MVRPRGARGFLNLSDGGLASMYRASDWSVLCSGPSTPRRAASGFPSTADLSTDVVQGSQGPTADLTY